jgi:hypothetical protein
MAKQLKIIIYWKQGMVCDGYKSHWIESHIDSYEISNDLLKLNRQKGSDLVLKLDDMIGFEILDQD